MRLCEVTRKDLLSKNKNEDPQKYARRISYVSTIKPLPLAKQLFMDTGTLTVPIKVGDYIVTIHLSGILKYIQDEMDIAHKDLPDRSLVYKALKKAVDNENIYVNCTCPDFRYRHSYFATMQDFKYGDPERRPAKITNPNNKGATCKHITAALTRPSQWLKYANSWINSVVTAYILSKKGEMESEEAIDELSKEKRINGPQDIEQSGNDSNSSDESPDTNETISNDDVEVDSNELTEPNE